MFLHTFARTWLKALIIMAALPAISRAEIPVLNLYSARHYQTDESLYQRFTETTGIKINRIEAGDEALLERLRAEGRHSPADVIVLADAARLWRAQIDGLFQPIQSALLERRIPANLRSQPDEQGSYWFGFSTRARVLVYNPDKVRPEQIQNYRDLANPALKGLVCTRSGAHPYMLSLISAQTEHLGIEGAQSWAQGVVDNFARPPRGGDTDQIKAVASGECGVALTNTYYYVRMLREQKPGAPNPLGHVKMIWPDQTGHGTHINISGGGVARYAPHRQAAIQFLEYLASNEAQTHFAQGNNEWPAVKGARTQNPVLDSLGPFKTDSLPIATVGRAQINAAKIIDRVGWR
jgi:iron(III) transport system substrate-binding protein